jgi:hypothetical protein
LKRSRLTHDGIACAHRFLRRKTLSAYQSNFFIGSEEQGQWPPQIFQIKIFNRVESRGDECLGVASADGSIRSRCFAFSAEFPVANFGLTTAGITSK